MRRRRILLGRLMFQTKRMNEAIRLADPGHSRHRSPSLCGLCSGGRHRGDCVFRPDRPATLFEFLGRSRGRSFAGQSALPVCGPLPCGLCSGGRHQGDCVLGPGGRVAPFGSIGWARRTTFGGQSPLPVCGPSRRVHAVSPLPVFPALAEAPPSL